MSTHPRRRRNCPLQVDFAILFEGTKVRSSESFRRNANLERGLVERCNGEAGAIYADAVSEMAVAQDFGGVGDGECCSAIFGLVIEFGDDCKRSAESHTING